MSFYWPELWDLAQYDQASCEGLKVVWDENFLAICQEFLVQATAQISFSMGLAEIQLQLEFPWKACPCSVLLLYVGRVLSTPPTKHYQLLPT